MVIIISSCHVEVYDFYMDAVSVGVIKGFETLLFIAIKCYYNKKKLMFSVI